MLCLTLLLYFLTLISLLRSLIAMHFRLGGGDRTLRNNDSSLRDAGLWRVLERYVTMQMATAYYAYLYIVMLINIIIKVYKY